MRNLTKAKVTSVHHWNDTLFSFKTTRERTFTFENGQFVMIGLEVGGKPLMRAYSIASANYDDELEFFSIKVPNGALTSHLQHLKVNDEVMMTVRPTGTLVPGYLIPGKRLFLLSTGTGLAPFMSIIRDPEIYEKFDKVILVHGTRLVSELAYQQEIEHDIPQNPYFGDTVSNKLLYYPTVTREQYQYNSLKTPNGMTNHEGRITHLITSGELNRSLNLPPLNTDEDRFMLCGNDAMLKDLMQILNNKNFVKANSRNMGHYVIEQAYIEK
jgi:ferredoxin--NADP+ reductase